MAVRILIELPTFHIRFPGLYKKNIHESQIIIKYTSLYLRLQCRYHHGIEFRTNELSEIIERILKKKNPKVI